MYGINDLARAAKACTVDPVHRFLHASRGQQLRTIAKVIAVAVVLNVFGFKGTILLATGFAIAAMIYRRTDYWKPLRDLVQFVKTSLGLNKAAP